MESEVHKTQALLERREKLERIAGQKQLQIDYLDMLIERGSAELGIGKQAHRDSLGCTQNHVDDTHLYLNVLEELRS